jgi:hypothetical protein
MKLAEALALRADLQARLAQLASRATTNARHQEGEEPAEDANALLAESDRVGDELAGLIVRINAQNLRTEVEPGVTMTAALARRDLLRQRHRLRTELADTASRPLDRFTRTELRSIPAVDVRALRAEADALARQLRELDTQIQAVNWATELEADE